MIAAITSCTTTANPRLMIAAGLLARNALALGLKSKPWVKCSLSPGSRVVADYLERCGLLAPLEALGFYIAGFGCMSCGGATGPLAPDIAAAIEAGQLVVGAVQSSNRNFEGRIHPQVKPSYLGSPALTVAYALAGSLLVDISADDLGVDGTGRGVKLADIWPDDREVVGMLDAAVRPDLYSKTYQGIWEGDKQWQELTGLDVAPPLFAWDKSSTFLLPPPYVSAAAQPFEPICGARALLMVGDSLTTDHISPAGAISPLSDTAQFLRASGVSDADFGSYVSRRVNAEAMVRGTFANPRIVNEMLGGEIGPRSWHMPDKCEGTIYGVASAYRAAGIPTIVIGGKEYGAGSSRDWAAKGTLLLGVRAIIAESFERIHRSNLVGMGVFPLEFVDGQTRKSLDLGGDEIFDIYVFEEALTPRTMVKCDIGRRDGSRTSIALRCRIDTQRELEWFLAGGVLPYALKQAAA